MTMSWSELINAVKLGRISDVQRYIPSAWSVNLNDPALVTCLHWASWYGHLEIVEYLCERGAKIDAITKRGNTPLMSAVINGSLLVTQYLIDKGANINKFNEDGLTPLHQAAIYGRLEIAKILTEKGAHVNSCSSDGNTPLFLATKYGRVEVVMHLIDSGADANIVNSEGETALDVAISQKHSGIATILTKHTKIISPQLMKTNDIETIKTLISNHANVNKPFKNNETPLLCAVKAKNLEIIKYLLDNGAEFSIHSAFMESIGTGNEEIVKLMLNKGAKVNRQYKNGSTPLLKAIEIENYEISQLLIQNGADVNLSDKNGCRPLELAAKNYNLKCFDYLIKSGGDVTLIKEKLDMVANENEDLEVYLQNLKLKEKEDKSDATTPKMTAPPAPVSNKTTKPYFTGQEAAS